MKNQENIDCKIKIRLSTESKVYNLWSSFWGKFVFPRFVKENGNVFSLLRIDHHYIIIIYGYMYRESARIINQLNETGGINIMDNFAFKHDFRVLDWEKFSFN